MFEGIYYKGRDFMIIEADDYQSGKHKVNIRTVSECPICSAKASTLIRFAHYDFNEYSRTKTVDVVFFCNIEDCRRLFIASYSAGEHSDVFNLVKISPENRFSREFSSVVKEISPEFDATYQESFFNDIKKFYRVCGIGYRRALEFLIKDYLIRLFPDQAGDIKTKALGRCIREYIKNPQILEVAKRAVWLGNDQAHYETKWISKNINDLKSLIDLTIFWIEAEELTKRLISEMPEK